MPFDPEFEHNMNVFFFKTILLKSSVTLHNPGVCVALAGVRCLAENGYLISTNPNGLSTSDGSYTAPSGEASTTWPIRNRL